MLAIALIASIAYMMNQQAINDIALVNNELAAQRAAYVAQAGLQHGQWLAAQQGCGPFTDVDDQPLGGATYATTLVAGQDNTDSSTLDVVQDSWIRSDLPDMTHPSDDKLHIRMEGGTIERAIYRYDLSSIPAGTTIVSATAWFYVTVAHPGGPVDIHRLTASWTEADATWNTLGDKIESAALTSIAAQPTANQWVSVNLTAQVQAWVNGQPNFGIALNTTIEGEHFDYASREHAQQPYLEVVTGSPPVSPATLTSLGILADGTGRSLSRDAVGLYQSPVSTASLQPDGAAGVDTYISEFDPTVEFGDDASAMVAQDTFKDSLSLFRFGLESIPKGARVLAAELSLYHHDTFDSNVPVTAHRITNSWDEGAANWTRREGIINWDNPGGDYDPQVEATTLVGPIPDQRHTWRIDGLVQGWVEGRFPNYGVVLRTEMAKANGEYFRTSDHADAGQRPRLTVTYSCACGTSCRPSLASGKIALVASTFFGVLSAEDTQRREMLESWGYDVDIHDHNFLWMLDTNNYDVVLILPSASAAAVGTQLTDEDVGIVSMHGELNDELGIGSTAQWPVGSGISLTDTSHYITQPFAAGALKLYDAGMEGLAAGSAASGAQTLASFGGSDALVTLDTGAALSGGGAAVNRRVLLPFGRTADWSRLDNNAHTLLVRAFTWAADADDTAPAVCGDMVPIRTSAGFSTPPYGSNNIRGLTFLPAGKVFNGVAAPADGAWLSVDPDSDRIYMTDTQGALLADRATPGGNATGIAFIELGSYTDHIVVSDASGDLVVMTLSGSQVATLNASGAADPVGVSYVGATASGSHDNALAVLDRSGQMVWITQSGSVLGTQDFSSGLSQPEDLAHLHGTDSLLLVDRGDDRVYKAGFDGTLAAHYDTPDFGSVGPFAIALNTATCEHAIGDASIRRVISLTDQERLPIAHWKLDETIGNVAADSAGGHDGTLQDNPSWTTGQVDGGLEFDGNDSVRVTHDDALSIDGSLTLMAWVNPNETVDWRTILTKGAVASEENYWLGLHDGRPSFGFYDGAGYRTFEAPAVQLDTGTWWHMAVTFDTSSGDIQFYVDAIAVYSVNTAYRPVVNSGTLSIGTSALNDAWDGLLDDVRIYDSVMDAAELDTLVQAGGGTVVPPPPPPATGACPGTFADHFDDRAFDNSDGDIDWSGDPWQEVGESDGAHIGDVQVRNDESNYQLRLRDNDNGGEGVERQLNLSGADSATLSYVFRRENLDDAGDKVQVLISATGSAPWVLLTEHAGPNNDGSYQNHQIDISAYASAQTRLRLITSPDMGKTDTVWFDNIEVTCTTAP